MNSEELLPPGITTAPPGSVPPPGDDYYTLANGKWTQTDCPISNANRSKDVLFGTPMHPSGSADNSAVLCSFKIST
jgi:hypothetical protein